MTYYIALFIFLVVGFLVIAILFNEETDSSEYQQEPNDMLSFLKQQKTKQ